MAFIPSGTYSDGYGNPGGNRRRRERRSWLQLTAYPQSPYREMSAYGPDYLPYSKAEGFPYGYGEYGEATPAAGAAGAAGAKGQAPASGQAAAAAIGAGGQMFSTIFTSIWAGKTAQKEMEHTQKMAEIESTLGAKRMDAESRLIAAQAKLAAVTKSHGPVIIGGIVTLGILSGLGYWFVKRQG